MKTKILILALILALFIAAFPKGVARADSSGIIYVAVNDELTNHYPYFYGARIYLPLSDFQSLGITYSADIDASTFILKLGSSSLAFDLATGDCYDGSGNSYGVKALYLARSVYLPAYFVAEYFGFTYSYIKGVGNGDVVRIKTSGAAYSDLTFMETFNSQLEERTNAYKNPNPTLTPAPTPTTTPRPTPTIDKSGTKLTFSFVGVPTDGILDVLEAGGIHAMFFVEYDEALANPGTLRRATGLGHRLGVWLGNEADEYIKTAELIYEITRIKTLFAAIAPEIAEEPPERSAQSAMILVDCGLDAGAEEDEYSLMKKLLDSRGSVALRFNAEQEGILPDILEFIRLYRFSIETIRETA